MNLTRSVTCLFCLLLTACGNTADVKETLGLTRNSPDEYRVVSRPPLNVPPEFNLRPPGEGEEYSSGVPADVRARSKVLGISEATAQSSSVSAVDSPTTGSADTAVPAVASGDLPSNADSQFLANAGAVKADPHVREAIQKDTKTGLTVQDDKYLYGGKAEGEPTVDPDKEAARLKKNKEENKAPTEGVTPVVQPKDKGILGDVF